MASWFNVESLKELTDQVSSAIPKLDGDLIKNLTLTSPELTAERQRIDAEERHKDDVRDMLAGLLPWETRDPERDILVEEAKEAILKLSSNEDVFLGPYQMPRLSVKLQRDKQTEEEDGEDKNELYEDAEDTENKPKGKMPSEESLERLRTLEPLPPLLQEFDLDSHVGLIQKLLTEDPNLVKMQSKLSGGGEHEKVFWRNYFFHCAWCRYEAGLSIDEIWSDQPPPLPSEGTADEKGTDVHEEQTITFVEEHEETTDEKAFPADPATDANAPFSRGTEGETPNLQTTAAAVTTETRSDHSASGAADFEMVGQSEGDGLSGEPVDYELDELEAEIARELEG